MSHVHLRSIIHLRSILSFAGFAFIIIVFGSYVIVAQSAVSGQWKAELRQKNQDHDDDHFQKGELQLSFTRNADNGRNQNGSHVNFEDLQGLTRQQTTNGPVRFSLVREAGTVVCEGTFNNGKGSGTFTFNPAPGYIDAMAARGFDFRASTSKDRDSLENRLFTAALVNVTTALADDLNSANLGKLDVDDLFKAAIFNIDSRFMTEMIATGFPNLTTEDLVKARILKIDADYVRQIHGMGLADNDFESLVKFRIFKVTPEFLTDLRNEGFANPSPEQVVQFRIFKIDVDFIRRARTSEPNVTVEQLVEMKIGVRKMRST